MINLSAQSPAPGSKQNNVDTLITFVVEKENIDIDKIFIRVNNEIAFQNSAFEDEYDDTLSSFTVNSDNISFSIEKKSNFEKDAVINVDIFYEDSSGSSNKAFSFKTVTDAPILFYSNLSDGDTLNDPMILRFEFIDDTDGIDLTSIQFSINSSKVIVDGVVQSSYSYTEVTSIEDGYRIDFQTDEFLRNGAYNIKYTVADTNGVKLIDDVSFKVKLKYLILPQLFPQSLFLNQIAGLKKATNIGDGKSIKLEWSKMFSRVPKSEVFGLLYYGNDRLSVFDSMPKLLFEKSINEYTHDEFETGLNYYLALRGMEAFKNTFELNGMIQLSTGVYKIPSEAEVSGVFDTDDLSLMVKDITGYPNKGLLIINDKEVVKYTSLDRTTNTFNIPSNGRALNNTKRGIFTDGDKVKLFVKCQDSNTNILKSVTDFNGDVKSGRTVNNVGVLVTDYTDNDKKFFQGFDYCGYHQPLAKRSLGRNR